MDASQVSHDLFLRILAVSVQASVLALLIVALQRLLGGWLSPAWRHALWGLLLARLLLLWSVPCSWSLYTALRNLWTSASGLVAAREAPVLPPGHAFVPTLSDGTVVAKGMEWAVGIWLCGAVLILAMAMLQAWRLGRQSGKCPQVTDPGVCALLGECRRQMGIRRPVPMLFGPDTGSPALLGFLRPRLLVPKRLLVPEARDQLHCVLLHELAHIRRQDVLTGWLAHLLLALHWFNPVLWWAKRRCMDDRELACDARVLAVLTPKERRIYGHVLLDQFRAASAPFSRPGLVGVLGGTSSIERRIEMITAFGKSTRKGSIPSLAIILLLTVTALTGTEETGLPAPAGNVAAVAAGHANLPIGPGQGDRFLAPILLAEETDAVKTPQPNLSTKRTVPATMRVDTALVLEKGSDFVPDAAPTQASLAATAPAADCEASTTHKPEAPHISAKAAPVKGDKPKVVAATNVPAAAPIPGTAPATQPAQAGEPPAPTPGPSEKPAAKNPPTLHTAVNKAARDYAESLEVKSTRPGEDPPFTLTVGGEIRVRGEYRTGMPRHSALPRNGFATSMNTRVRVCADFGQAQCVAEVSKTEGPAHLCGPRDSD